MKLRNIQGRSGFEREWIARDVAIGPRWSHEPTGDGQGIQAVSLRCQLSYRLGHGSRGKGTVLIRALESARWIAGRFTEPELGRGRRIEAGRRDFRDELQSPLTRPRESMKPFRGRKGVYAYGCQASDARVAVDLALDLWTLHMAAADQSSTLGSDYWQTAEPAPFPLVIEPGVDIQSSAAHCSSQISTFFLVK